MHHSLKCIVISLLPLSQVGCAPASHDDSAADPYGSARMWAAGEFTEDRDAAATRSSEDPTTHWHLTLTCNASNLGVEIEVPTEHIMPVLLPGTLGRRADVSYRFGEGKAVSGLWQMDLHKRAVFLEGEEAERFMAQMRRNSRLVIQVNYAHRQFNTVGTGDVLQTIRRNCSVMDASVTFESLPTS